VSFLTEPQRRAVFDKVITLVDTKFSGADIDVKGLRDVHGPRVVGSRSQEDFEQALDGLLRDLKTSHTGFSHESRPRSAGRIAMAATLTKADTSEDGQRWVFQDVHPGGVAAAVGISSGDVLLAVDGNELVPPAATPFRLGQSYALTVRKDDGSTSTLTLAIPGSREKQRPIVVPDRVVTSRTLADEIGYVRVSMFPGILGIDVARDISRAISELECSRLVVDLRGNTGGGIGCLRLMSHLCPDRRGVGYSVGRKLAQKGYDKERLPQFDRIPSSKLQVLPLIVKFGLAGRSVAVFTESLGPQRHHGHVALLVNE
jgi:carboxyl-terminal processing protease